MFNKSVLVQKTPNEAVLRLSSVQDFSGMRRGRQQRWINVGFIHHITNNVFMTGTASLNKYHGLGPDIIASGREHEDFSTKTKASACT